MLTVAALSFKASGGSCARGNIVDDSSVFAHTWRCESMTFVDTAMVDKAEEAVRDEMNAKLRILALEQILSIILREPRRWTTTPMANGNGNTNSGSALKNE